MDAKTETKTLQHFIGGDWLDAEDGETITSFNPIDDSIYCYAAKGTGNDIRKAIAAARATFPAYKKTTAKERERMLLRVAEIMEEREDEIINCLIDEIGSPLGKAQFEFAKGLTLVRAAAGMVRNVRGETFPSDTPGKFSMSIREPVGVVAIITPFNVPLIKTTRLVANALALGNTVVHLPSEMAPHITILMAEIIRDAGFPAGAYNVVTGNGVEIGDDLTSSKDIDFLTFTGSSAVGQHVHEICARNKTKNTLELGGKSPNIIFADASIDQAVEGIVSGIWFNQGQVCCAGSRVFVEESVLPDVVDRLRARMDTLRVGDPLDKNTDVGAINSPEQLATIQRYLDVGAAEGAEAHVAAGDPLPDRGYWCRPTFFTGVEPAHTIAREEIFGPVLAVMSFRTPDEAIRRANDTPYGLSAGIWTDKGSKMFAVARKLKAGVVWCNTFNRFDPTAPFGGFKESGFGREGGMQGLRPYVRFSGR
ncbi:MAG: aldehyde dehydrogenase [Phycisphaerales bacterium]